MHMKETVILYRVVVFYFYILRPINGTLNMPMLHSAHIPHAEFYSAILEFIHQKKMKTQIF